jgi:NAD-dependent SIR2 family protein deacetylase
MKKDGGSWHKGKCQKCKVSYNWTGGPRLKDARCPKCGGGLSWTSWEDGGPWEVLQKPEEIQKNRREFV